MEENAHYWDMELVKTGNTICALILAPVHRWRLQSQFFLLITFNCIKPKYIWFEGNTN